jgi:hypothetical protein
MVGVCNVMMQAAFERMWFGTGWLSTLNIVPECPQSSSVIQDCVMPQCAGLEQSFGCALDTVSTSYCFDLLVTVWWGKVIEIYVDLQFKILVVTQDSCRNSAQAPLRTLVVGSRLSRGE